MRQGQNSRRSRNRNNNGGSHRRSSIPNRNQTFDSNGPEVRIRGNAYQVHEKYLALARDAYSAGDRVKSENYYQHAEHYHRIITAFNEAHAQTQQAEAPRDMDRDAGADREMPRPEAAASNGQAAARPGNGHDAVDDPDAADQERLNGQHPTRANLPEPVETAIDVVSVQDPRDQDAASDAFGADPRQDDGQAEDLGVSQPTLNLGTPAEPVEQAEEPPAKPRRRRTTRPRRTAAAGADAAEAPAQEPPGE